MKRGSLVRVALPGDLGKPRPALVIQDQALFDTNARVIVVPLTSTLQDAPAFRITVLPSAANGLHVPSQAMIDRITSISVDKIGGTIGEIDDDVLSAVMRNLLILLGVK